MNILTIYTPQNGEFFKTALDATVTLLKESSFSTAMEIMGIFAVCMVGYQYVMGKKIASLQRFFLISFAITACLLGIKTPVAIIDMQYAEGAGSALAVDNVPLGLALPAAIISGIGYGITQAFSDVFHMPADMDYNKTGMIFGSRTWLAATNNRLSMSPAVASDMSTYIRQCVFAAKLLASHQISPSELVNSSALIKTYFENPSPIYRVVFQDGKNLGCAAAAANLKSRLNSAAKLELKRLDDLMGGSGAKAGAALQAAHDYYMHISESAGSIITQNILINATRDAAADAFSFSGAEAQLMNYTNTASMQKMHIAEANSFWLASYRLPYYMTVMWMLTICIFPLIILLAMLPLTQNVFAFYLQSQAYLWSWPPMFIIIHFFVSIASAHTISLFGTQTGGVTFSNIDSLASMHSNFAYTAGALAASVPFLAYYITKGLSSVLSNAAQHFGGMAQSVSMSEAQSAAQGNISMASYSGWNMNYDNTNAHKFDTNRSHAEGRSTLQMPNGSLLAQNTDGSRVGNISPAISSSGVSVHGSDRVVDSLHQSANESFNNAKSHRTSADTHLQTALSDMQNFNVQDSNEYRSGQGVANTDSASIGEDLRIMQDSMNHYNKHHDISDGTSKEWAGRAHINTKDFLPGKLSALFSGASGEGSFAVRRSASNNKSYQEFDNSSDGKAYNAAYHNMITTAKNSHLDAADSHHLSKSEQIAANFAKSESLMSQAGAEYSHGTQLQNAASHASENSKSIDDNLNQAYHDYVVENYGDRGEQTMLKADSQSIKTQHQWANEFLNSGVGKNAINAEVNSVLSQAKNPHQTYNNDANHIKKTHDIHGQYTKDQDIINDKANFDGLNKMDHKHLHASQDLLADQRAKSPIKQRDIIGKFVDKKVSDTKIKSNKEK